MSKRKSKQLTSDNGKFMKKLQPFELWMVKQNLQYVQEEGLETVLNRLKQQGYNRVANAVEEQYKNQNEYTRSN